MVPSQGIVQELYMAKSQGNLRALVRRGVVR